jgi:CubicO group peptidase (beta-lactamase class C family)
MEQHDWVYDWAFDDFLGKLEERIQQGWRVLSISQYGEGQDTRFAGLFVNRPGPRLDWVLGWAQNDFVWACAEKAKAGFYPILVTGNGGGSNANFSAVFEERAQNQSTEISISVDLAAYPREVEERAKNLWIARSAALHDDSANATVVTTVWDRNTNSVGWNAFAGLDHAQFEEHFQQQHKVWGRPAFATGSTTGRRLVIYRDDQIDQIGTGFVLRPAMTGEDWQAERTKLLEQGIYPVCLQGHGTGEGRRFAAIFQRSETSVARVIRQRGSPGVTAIDAAVTNLMKASNIRGAALAIVNGTKLVYARSYSWAEPDYPVVEPTTVFRLASVSKLPIALAIHQAAVEGLLGTRRLEARLPDVIPLTNPDGSAPTNTAYLNGTVRGLLEYNGLFERYEGRYAEIRAEFNGNFPVTYDQIARYMLTVPIRTTANDKLDDFGYFLAGQIVRRLRNKSTVEVALVDRLLDPLGIKRLRVARSLLAHQKPDEARYHPRDLGMVRSIMSNNQPIVPRGYGDEHFETREGSGGLSGAAVDVARILAAMNAKPYSPLGRPAVESLLAHAATPGRLGHGFDWIETVGGKRRGPKGGLLQTSQSGIWFEEDGLCSVVVWNGLHTGKNLWDGDPGDGAGWYPRFDTVLNAAAGINWGATDLFPDYGMAALPTTQSNWRWCSKCEGMYFAGHGTSVCPAGGTHGGSKSHDYKLMMNSAFPYSQNGWRWCKKCQGLHYGAPPFGVCPAGGTHDGSGSGDYHIVTNSPYNEEQQGWRFCKKCYGMFFSAHPTHGTCPAGDTHDPTGSFAYAIAP